MRFFQCFLLVGPQLAVGLERLYAADTAFQFFPIFRGFEQGVKINPAYGRVLVFNRLRCIGAPFIGGRNPESLAKFCRLELFVLKSPAGRSQKAIHGGFINRRIFLIKFALYGPIFAVVGEGHEVDACIAAAQVQFTGEFIPQPDVFKAVGVLGVGLQIDLHQALEAVAFVAFGEGYFPVFIEYMLECHRCVGIEQ